MFYFGPVEAELPGKKAVEALSLYGVIVVIFSIIAFTRGVSLYLVNLLTLERRNRRLADILINAGSIMFVAASFYFTFWLSAPDWESALVTVINYLYVYSSLILVLPTIVATVYFSRKEGAANYALLSQIMIAFYPLLLFAPLDLVFFRESPFKLINLSYMVFSILVYQFLIKHYIYTYKMDEKSNKTDLNTLLTKYDVSKREKEIVDPKHWVRVGDPIQVSKFDNYGITKVKAERAVAESGLKYWKTYGNFIDTVYRILGVVNFRKLYNPGWFALKNFHCSWFRDSDILENYLHFRQQSFTDYLDKLKRKIPSSIKIIGYIPARIIKRFVMKPLAGGANGPFGWIKRGEWEKVEAFYGSVEKWEQGYKNWNDLDFDPVADENLEGSEIDHGWQEGKDPALIDGNDMREAAFFRGGKCLSSDMKKGDLFTPLKWECSQGHIFTATPFIVLKGGHWCPECDIDPFTYGKNTNKDKLLAQVL